MDFDIRVYPFIDFLKDKLHLCRVLRLCVVGRPVQKSSSPSISHLCVRPPTPKVPPSLSLCVLPIWLVPSITSPVDTSWTEKKEHKYPEQGRLDKICYNKVTVLPVMLMNHWITLSSHSGSESACVSKKFLCCCTEYLNNCYLLNWKWAFFMQYCCERTISGTKASFIHFPNCWSYAEANSSYHWAKGTVNPDRFRFWHINRGKQSHGTW